jgi:hypothetical protein
VAAVTVDCPVRLCYSGNATSVNQTTTNEHNPRPLSILHRCSSSGVGVCVSRSTMGRKPKPTRIIEGEPHWRCPRCERWLPRGAYSTEPRRPNGLDGRCKECRRTLRKKRRDETRDHVREQGRRYYREKGGKEKARVAYRKDPRRYITIVRASEARYPEKRKARTAAYHARQAGVLDVPAKCSRCGRADLQIEGHHPNYSRPLDVEWLCTVCHGQEHRA